MNFKHLALAVLLFAAPAIAPAADIKPAAQKKTIRRVEVQEFDKLRADTNAVVLDVRTVKEYKAGHIPGAVLIDIHAPGFDEKIAKLDKGKTYLVHCAAGVRSANACSKMAKAGFTNVIDLAPGFRGWEKAGKPVEK
jgi:phage shock protein E